MADPAKAAAILYAKSIEPVSTFYRHVLGLEMMGSEADRVVLESPLLQLVIVAIPEAIAASIEISTPPLRREETPLKLVFPVESIGTARTKAKRFGGEIYPEEQEWKFQEFTVCDGHDPEGNVLQLRRLEPRLER